MSPPLVCVSPASPSRVACVSVAENLPPTALPESGNFLWQLPRPGLTLGLVFSCGWIFLFENILSS